MIQTISIKNQVLSKLNRALIFCLALILTNCNSPEPQSETKPESETEATSAPEKGIEQEGTNSTENDPILGIDVSHFQGDINWQEIKEANIQYVYDKATEGVTYADPDFQNNRKGAQSVDLIHGGYHFYIASDDPIAQANHFISTLSYSEGDLPPVLDLEQGGMKEGIVVEDFQKDVLSWLSIVEKSMKVQPVIYTSNAFGNTYLNNPKFGEYELWIAEYGVETPKIPAAWNGKPWLFWQRSQRGTIEGAIGQVDHDLYNSKVRDLGIGSSK